MRKEPALVVSAIGLIIVGLMALRAIAADIFPLYYLYVVVGILVFWLFSRVDFDILLLFSKHLYVLSVIFLALPLVFGEVTRGAARWIQLGDITIQPAEIVRPFLILFFASLLVDKELTRKSIFVATALLLIPISLILLQPSLGVAVLTLAGFAGVGLSLRYNKKLLLFVVFAVGAASPLFWFFLAPYQKTRLLALISPVTDPTGAGYNSIQSMIAVGSGMLFGRGLGEGVQTQLYFLPERHSDFIFAAISEELGFIGALLVIGLAFFLLYRVVVIVEKAKSPAARAFASGVFVTFFMQIMIHLGMNMGLLPITGQPLLLVSAGGSSMVATMMTLGMLVQAKRDN